MNGWAAEIVQQEWNLLFEKLGKLDLPAYGEFVTTGVTISEATNVGEDDNQRESRSGGDSWPWG